MIPVRSSLISTRGVRLGGHHFDARRNIQTPTMSLRLVKSLSTCALLAFASASSSHDHPGVFPISAAPYGLTYAEWSAGFWRWFMEHPLVGHPGIDDPSFDVTSGQSGPVWYLATPVEFDTRNPTLRTRHISIPSGTSLFVGMLTGEMSSNEGAATEAEQRDIANFQADVITMEQCTLDGYPVDTGVLRFESPQFSFTAPDPWIFSPSSSGPGTAVGDGYYVFLKPMSVGRHVLHYRGYFDFGGFFISADQTYIIDVRR